MRAGQKRARKDVDVDRWESGAGRAQEWEGGGVRSIATGGWVGEGGMGLEGRGTTGPSEKVQQQQQTKHCRRWREGP